MCIEHIHTHLIPVYFWVVLPSADIDVGVTSDWWEKLAPVDDTEHLPALLLLCSKHQQALSKIFVTSRSWRWYHSRSKWDMHVTSVAANSRVLNSVFMSIVNTNCSASWSLDILTSWACWFAEQSKQAEQSLFLLKMLNWMPALHVAWHVHLRLVYWHYDTWSSQI